MAQGPQAAALLLRAWCAFQTTQGKLDIYQWLIIYIYIYTYKHVYIYIYIYIYICIYLFMCAILCVFSWGPHKMAGFLLVFPFKADPRRIPSKDEPLRESCFGVRSRNPLRVCLCGSCVCVLVWMKPCFPTCFGLSRSNEETYQQNKQPLPRYTDPFSAPKSAPARKQRIGCARTECGDLKPSSFLKPNGPHIQTTKPHQLDRSRRIERQSQPGKGPPETRGSACPAWKPRLFMSPPNWGSPCSKGVKTKVAMPTY